MAAGMCETTSGIAVDAGASDFGVWPPLWPVVDGAGDRGTVSMMIRLLDLSEDDYDDVIRETAELLRDPAMQSWISRVAAALLRSGFLTGEEIEARRPSTPIKEMTCST